MTNFFDPGFGEFVAVDGHLVERDALNIVEKLKDLNPSIEVLCLDPERADNLAEEPFQVIEIVNGQVQKILGCWELDDRVIERVRLADSQHSDILDRLAKLEIDKQKETDYAYAQKRGEAIDLVTAVAKNRKTSFSFKKADGDTVTLFDNKPAEVS